MPDFIRRYLAASAMLRAPEGEGGASLPDASASAAEAPAVEGTAQAENPAPEASPPVEAPAAAPAPAPAPDRAQQRMNQLVAERWAERRRAEEAENRSRLLQEQLNQTREALQPQVGADGQPVQQPPVARSAAPQDLQAMAAQIAAQNEFNRQVQEEVLRGRDPARGGHADFDAVASNLQRFGELPRTFVEAALATGKGAEVMYHLGGDIAEADRILSLPPIPQAVALAKLAESIKPVVAKTVTSAPNPVSPRVAGGPTSTVPSLEDEKMSTADWIALREKQLAANKGKSSARR